MRFILVVQLVNLMEYLRGKVPMEYLLTLKRVRNNNKLFKKPYYTE